MLSVSGYLRPILSTGWEVGCGEAGAARASPVRLRCSQGCHIRQKGRPVRIQYHEECNVWGLY